MSRGHYRVAYIHTPFAVPGDQLGVRDDTATPISLATEEEPDLRLFSYLRRRPGSLLSSVLPYIINYRELFTDLSSKGGGGGDGTSSGARVHPRR